MKVLIVDDNASDRKLLRLILERHDITEVMEAGDGFEGLEAARRGNPELIISDALMPRLDGFQLLWTLNNDEELRKIPFVFYSAVYTGVEDEELASRLGAEGFITRPKEPGEFWLEMSAILEKINTGNRNSRSSRLMNEEKEYLRRYCEIVTGKLEEKVRDLECNIARRRVVEEELTLSRERLKALAAELARAEETERSRIALELHDAVGQRLAHMRMALASLEKAPQKAPRAIEDLRGSLDTVIQQIRSLTFRISPPVLRLVGLEAAVESLCEKFQEDYGIRFIFTRFGASRAFPEDLKGGLYRMVRELLFNAVKHAGAETVYVSVNSTEERVEISVEDNGRGFDTAELYQKEGKRNCLGLFSIRERMEYLGGSMEIDSQPGRGTCLHLSLPLKGC